MEIIQKVLIKQVITKKSKDVLSERFKNEKMQLEQECQQLIFEQKRLEKRNIQSKTELSKRFSLEIKKRDDKVNLIGFKLKQLDKIEFGSEIIEKEVEALVEVSVGMAAETIFSKRSIIVKDGIVIRIDEE